MSFYGGVTLPVWTLDIGQRWMVGVMPWPLTPSETTLSPLKTGGCAGPGTGPNMAERKVFSLQGTKPQFSPPPLQFQHTAIPWSLLIRYLGLELNSKLLFTKHKATGIFLKLFPLLARDSTLSCHNKLTLYKLMIRPVLTYAAPVWSNTSSSNYRHLQLLQSKCLTVIGNYPRRTPSHTFTLFLTSNPCTSLFTVWRINFSTTVLLTLTLLSDK